MSKTTMETSVRFARRIALLDSENAFKIGPYIRELEAEGERVI